MNEAQPVPHYLTLIGEAPLFKDEAKRRLYFTVNSRYVDALKERLQSYALICTDRGPEVGDPQSERLYRENIRALLIPAIETSRELAGDGFKAVLIARKWKDGIHPGYAHLLVRGRYYHTIYEVDPIILNSLSERDAEPEGSR